MKSVQAYYKNLEETQEKTVLCALWWSAGRLLAAGMILETTGDQNFGDIVRAILRGGLR